MTDTARSDSDLISKPGICLMIGVAFTVGVELLESQLFVFSAAPVQAGIHVSQFEYSMIALAYAVMAITMIFTQGHWVRLWGYRRFLIGSLAVFTVSCLLCALSENLWELVLARIVQAIGGGTLFTTARVLLQTQIQREYRALAVRIFLMGVFTPAALAPVLSGMAVQNWGWQAIFLIPIPFALIAIALLWRGLPRHHGWVKNVIPTDLPIASLGLVMLGIFVIELAFTEWRYKYFYGFGHLPLLLMIGIVLAWYFVRSQTRHAQPLLRVHELGNSSYLLGLFFYFWYYFLNSANSYVFPIFVEKSLGYSFISAGTLLSTAALFGLAVLTIYLLYFFKYKSKRPFMVFALIAMSMYGFCMSMLPADVNFTHITVLTMMRSMCNVLLVTPLAGVTFSELNEDIFAHGYQTKNILRQLSTTLAVSVSAVFLDARDSRHMMHLADASNQLTAVSAEIHHYALALACADFFRWQGICATVILIILLLQKRLR